MIPSPVRTSYAQESVERYALAHNAVRWVLTAVQKRWHIGPPLQCNPPMSQTPPSSRQNPNSAGRTSRPRLRSSFACLPAAAILAALVPASRV